MLWRFAERCGTQGINFVVSIVLARILSPDEYGTVALVVVFVAIFEALVSGGFPNALIQKKEVTNLDFSTVFYFNLFSCIVMYAVLYLIAPLIAGFYNSEVLVNVLRILGLKIILSGLFAVQNAYVARTMQFKKYFYATIIGTILSAIVGICMVYGGCGVWALVVQALTAVSANTIILWFTSGFKPKFEFSFSILKGLFSYGWKLLVANLLANLYTNLRSLIISKAYSTTDLGFYNKGEQFPNVIIANLNTSIDSVLFPSMAQAQDDLARLKAMTRRSVKTTSYIVWPCMIGLLVCAEPLVKLLLTDAWLESVPYLRLFCISYAFLPMQTANLNAMKALGRSDVFLKLQTIGKIVGVLSILITMQFGVYAIALGTVFVSVFETIIKAYPNKRFIKYSYKEQFQDILPSMLMSAFMGLCVWWVQYLNLNLVIVLIIQIVTGTVIYSIASAILKLETFNMILKLLMNEKTQKLKESKVI